MSDRNCRNPSCTAAHYAKGLCRRCYNAAYRRVHRERAAATNAAWRAAHEDQTRQAWAAWYAENRTAELLRRKRGQALASYYANHDQSKALRRAARRASIAAESEADKAARLEARRARYAARADHYRLKALDYTHRRNARKIGAPVTATDYRAILAEHGMTCHICRAAITDANDLHFDHVVPLSKGGRHAPENIRPAHAFCNLQKGAKLLA